MSNKMKILQFRKLSGPNYWSLHPCIQMLLDIGDLEALPTNMLDQSPTHATQQGKGVN